MTLAALRPFLPWLTPPALAALLWAAHDFAADRRASAAASRATQLCEAAWRAREADANAHALETADEIRRRIEAVRPDPARVPERLRDGSFLIAPGALGGGLPED